MENIYIFAEQFKTNTMKVKAPKVNKVSYDKLASNFIKSISKFLSPKNRALLNNVTNTKENHKLIIYTRNFEYFGLWVQADQLEKAHERFQNEAHLIVNSPIEGAYFLKVQVRKIDIINEYPREHEVKPIKKG